MNSPRIFDPARFSYLNLELNDESTGRPPCQDCVSRREAEEVAGDCPTFTSFAELPLELQRRIWHFAALLPRIVEVHEVQFCARIVEALELSDDKPTSPPQIHDIRHLRSRTDAPPLLRTCRESREIALRRYRKTGLANQYCTDSVYFDFDCDTVYLSYSTIKAWHSRWMAQPCIYRTQYPPRLSNKVRSLAFGAGLLVQQSIHSTPGHSCMVPNPYVCKELAEKLSGFWAPEEIIIVLNENHMTTIDERLSLIRFHEPSAGSGIAGLLEGVANLFRKELQNSMAQRAHMLRQMRRNLGLIPALDPVEEFLASLKVPVVRTTVIRLKPASAGLASDEDGASSVNYLTKQMVMAQRSCFH